MGIFLIKEIKSKEGELHFRRWRIISTPWFSVYIHGIYMPDEDAHLHDHPWNYASLVLKGSFTEQTLKYNYIESTEIDQTKEDKIKIKRVWKNAETAEKVVSIFDFITRNAKHFHKIKVLHSKSVYTLFFTGRRLRDWGYDVDGTWVSHQDYRLKKRNNTLNQENDNRRPITDHRIDEGRRS